MRKWLPKATPIEAPDYDELVTYAVRAFYEGKATEAQQKLVWEWLMYVTTAGDGYQDLSFRPGVDGARYTDFAEGKRFVGLTVRKQLDSMVTPKNIKRG